MTSPKKKNILVMSFGSDPGGIEKSLIEFLKFLIREGHHVDLYLWRAPGLLYNSIPPEVNKLQYRLYPGSLSNAKNIKDLVWYLRMRIAAIMKNPTTCFRRFPGEPYDIAISYCQNGYSPHYIIDKVIATKKIMFYHHGSYDSTGRTKALDEAHYLKYDKFITVSHTNRRMLESHFPSLTGKITVINNLIDEKNIKRLAEENVDVDTETVTLCTVGRISPEKGQMLAIEAAKELKYKGIDFKWYFVGDGEDRAKCENAVGIYGLHSNCFFVGMKTNPYTFIKHCDYYVQPSHIEADPVVIREVKVLKKPIIATNILALQEALSYGEDGILCDETAESLACGIISAIRGNCPTKYSDISANLKIEKQLIQLLK